MPAEVITPRARFIKGTPPDSGRSQSKNVRANWAHVVNRARSKPGVWLVVEKHPAIDPATSNFRHYDDIEAITRSGQLYIRAVGPGAPESN